MSIIVRLCVIVVFCVGINSAEDLNVGTTVNTILAYTEDVKLSAVPLMKREKNVFYNSKNATKIIKGISAIDLDKSKARASITSGGVGSNFVNVRMKSNRGDGLHYHVQIFV